MAGRGPAPKANRQRRNKPERGEWVDVPPLEKPVLPDLPRNRKWHKRTRAAWKRWREDPVTGLYGPAEVQMALDLAEIYDEWVQGGGGYKLAAEVRQWLDRLGLNPKGKRDLRWRVKQEAELIELPTRRERAHIRAV